MACQHYDIHDGGERVFEVEAPRIKYGRGALEEAGAEARALGMTRVALFSDPQVAKLAPFTTVQQALRAAGIDAVAYTEASVEPTDTSFKAAAAFAADGKFDGYISVGGGSSIDTAKAANLYATYPTGDFLDYVNAPIGGAKPIPGPLRPHIACPTTAGTGSECTGVTIFDLLAREVKTGIASRYLRPSLGIVDPDCTRTLPSNVVACAGFDVLAHALESFTARPYTARERTPIGTSRPLSQGANPYSDIACLEALRILGTYIERAVADASDDEARERMMFAATLAGIGFGNSGVHAPHGMAYAVAGLVHDYHAPSYPGTAPIVPHGMSVIVSAPAVFRFMAEAAPERHIDGARALGAKGERVAPGDAGTYLSARVVELMRATGMPNGLRGVGYAPSDIDDLVTGAFAQQRLLQNAPRSVDKSTLNTLFHDALAYW